MMQFTPAYAVLVGLILGALVARYKHRQRVRLILSERLKRRLDEIPRTDENGVWHETGNSPIQTICVTILIQSIRENATAIDLIPPTEAYVDPEDNYVEPIDRKPEAPYGLTVQYLIDGVPKTVMVMPCHVGWPAEYTFIMAAATSTAADPCGGALHIDFEGSLYHFRLSRVATPYGNHVTLDRYEPT
ncbi:MAG TPA: hypothetical protein VGK19_05210 [Capsulimonadaceae bacterium]